MTDLNDDLPEGAKLLHVLPGADETTRTYVYEVPVAEPEPPTLARKMAERHFRGGVFSANKYTDADWVWQEGHCQRLIDDLGLVCREDIPHPGDEWVPRGSNSWATSPTERRELHGKIERLEAKLAEATIRFGVPTRPTVAQVMEALGWRQVVLHDRTSVWRRNDGLGRRQEITHRDATEALTAIGAARPDAETP